MMEALTFFDTEVDVCRFCGGVWMDAGELAGYIKRGNVPKRILSSYCLDDSRKQVDEGRRACPRCGDLLSVTCHKGINLDQCHKCKGIWFDRGEIQSIMAAYHKEADPKALKKQPARLRSTIDEQGDEIIKVEDWDMREFLEDGPKQSPSPADAVEMEFHEAGGKDAVARAAAKSISQKEAEKSKPWNAGITSNFVDVKPLFRPHRRGLVAGVLAGALFDFASSFFGSGSD
jgi:Zn-finger nucleic acid-binding protein